MACWLARLAFIAAGVTALAWCAGYATMVLLCWAFTDPALDDDYAQWLAGLADRATR